MTASVKQIIFSHFFSIFDLGSITKHLVTGPTGDSEFCFPSTLNVFPRPLNVLVDGLRETKLTVSHGALAVMK